MIKKAPDDDEKVAVDTKNPALDDDSISHYKEVKDSIKAPDIGVINMIKALNRVCYTSDKRVNYNAIVNSKLTKNIEEFCYFLEKIRSINFIYYS